MCTLAVGRKETDVGYTSVTLLPSLHPDHDGIQRPRVMCGPVNVESLRSITHAVRHVYVTIRVQLLHLSLGDATPLSSDMEDMVPLVVSYRHCHVNRV